MKDRWFWKGCGTEWGRCGHLLQAALGCSVKCFFQALDRDGIIPGNRVVMHLQSLTNYNITEKQPHIAFKNMTSNLSILMSKNGFGVRNWNFGHFKSWNSYRNRCFEIARCRHKMKVVDLDENEDLLLKLM